MPKIEINEDLDARIQVGVEISKLCKADVIRHALNWAPQLAARFSPAPLWLEERINEALAEPAEEVTLEEFHANMQAIADGQ